MKYIIKPFSEIMIKSKPVRKRQLNMLTTNLNLAFRNIGIDVKARLFWDKIEVSGANNEYKKAVNNILSKIPGVETFLDVEEFEIINPEEFYTNEEIFDNIFQKAKEFFLDVIKNKSFVVRVKRSGLHNFTSTDVERYIGGGLLKLGENCSVKLKGSEITVRIEIKNNKAYIIKEAIAGIGGYPTGTQDKILSLLSGGFDSGVSSFAMMKRGCKVDFLFFNLGGNAHEIGVKQVALYLNQNFSAGYKARIITVPFEEIITILLTKVNHRFRGILLKRFMLRIADKLAQEHEYFALVKGDSLGQVSSQTLKNMFVIDKASDTLVLRPLISFNKQEIVDISKKIGTYDFACSMPEYCGVISDKPATGARLEQILDTEEPLDLSILETAYENKKVEFVNDIVNSDNKVFKIDTVNSISENEILIDIRDNEKKQKNPLKKEEMAFIEIPFFEINHKFRDLDQEKQYLFYCDKGILSHLHALYLKDKGFNNIKIFRKQ